MFVPPVTLQRASAGSGKTFALARRFIWYYITIAPEDAEEGGFLPRRLRTREELYDSLPRLLAMTFTNKATNEMKTRIVEKLNALGCCESAADPMKTDYLKDFIRDLSHPGRPAVTVAEVARTAREALRILLDGFSNFNVTTIDSFFQKVLRTFAYETGVAESYQVELDSKMLSSVGINSVLDELETTPASVSAFWIGEVIRRSEGKNWNIFNRKESTGFQKTEYGKLLKNIEKLENEEFKQIRSQLEQYFHSGGDGVQGQEDFRELFESMVTHFDGVARTLFEEMHASAARLRSLMPDDLKEVKGASNLRFFKQHAALCDLPRDAFDDLPASNLYEYDPNSKTAKAYLKAHPEVQTNLMPLYEDVNDKYKKWKAALQSQEQVLWKLYRENMPFLGLLMAFLNYRREYLAENNSIELAETSYLLRQIISDVDAPFIFERLGNRLNHFLIDEFQDTSRLQWENMRPLLAETVSRGQESLIIGDAKQSIYRFRNADYSLITSQVERDFPGQVVRLGNSPADNTNWRSKLRVVQFNNSFFDFLARALPETFVRQQCDSRARVDFADIYSNVKQTPHSKEADGYVEVRFTPPLSEGPYAERIRVEVARLIAGLHARGRDFKDIAVLVGTNKEAAQIIEGIKAYNLDRPEEAADIPFVSETSLLVSSAPSVQLLEAVLAAVARGLDPDFRKKLEENPHAKLQWNDISFNFKFFTLGKEDEEMPELLNQFLTEDMGANRLTEMLRGMESVAIPAIVEKAVATFLSEDMRRRDAVFIAAFQDKVMEYCESRPTDIGSFMNWWKTARLNASITSPEGHDAVQIITIHKAKGLEYPCVIVPFNTWDFADKCAGKSGNNKEEWRWVRPLEDDLDPDGAVLGAGTGRKMPPFVPLAIRDTLLDTPYEPLLTEHYDQLKGDYINAAYVAYTRASEELYIFAATPKEPKNKKKKEEESKTPPPAAMSDYLMRFLKRTSAAQDADPAKDLPLSEISCKEPDTDASSSDASVSAPADDELVFTIGKRPDIGDRKKKKHSFHIEHYAVTETPKKVHYRMEQLPYIDFDIEMDDGLDAETHIAGLEERNPRSEGNVKHAILERVKVEGDLHKAVMDIELRGLVSHELARKYERQLEECLADVRDRRWFDGTMRVVNERSVISGGRKPRRPDRIMIDKDTNAVIVDYKFGMSEDNKAYRRQVSGYIRALRDTCRYRTVRGYLWYVNQGLILEVDCV